MMYLPRGPSTQPGLPAAVGAATAVELDRLLAKQVKNRFKGESAASRSRAKYRLPAPARGPIQSEIEYTRDLGYGAVDYLKQLLDGGEPGGMITPQRGRLGSAGCLRQCRRAGTRAHPSVLTRTQH
jgi:hypothetical protein